MKRHSLKTGAVARARSLRRGGTPEERILWQTLRKFITDAKFRRQVPIGPYFVDFLSHRAKLVVELDGAQHALQGGYDDERTRFLNSEGYRVLRFWNRDVAENLDGVCRSIQAALAPSPLVGEGGPKDRMRGEAKQQPLTHSPSPLVGEGGPKDRMRGEEQEQPLTPCPLPQGEREVPTKSPILES